MQCFQLAKKNFGLHTSDFVEVLANYLDTSCFLVTPLLESGSCLARIYLNSWCSSTRN